CHPTCDRQRWLPLDHPCCRSTPEISRRSTLLGQPASRQDRTRVSGDGSPGSWHNQSHRPHICRVEQAPAVLPPYSRPEVAVEAEKESEDSDEWRQALKLSAWPSNSTLRRPNRRLVLRSGDTRGARSERPRRSRYAEGASLLRSVCPKSQTQAGRELQRERLHRLYRHE